MGESTIRQRPISDRFALSYLNKGVGLSKSLAQIVQPDLAGFTVRKSNGGLESLLRTVTSSGLWLETQKVRDRL